MRKFLARAIFCGIFAAVCATATNAADLSSGSNGGSGYYSAYGTRNRADYHL